ncbi:hypothetical protein A5881_001563 [Enterococcus termitis]|nr:hypothetical protein A5881_002116 [Enterococcus termitis]
MQKADWLSQVKRGVLEYSIMSILSKEETYGYDIIATLAQWEVLETKEGTVYPLLKRLEREQLIQYTWRNSVEGLPPRKYYSLTLEGINFLKIMDNEWKNLNTAIDKIKR